MGVKNYEGWSLVRSNMTMRQAVPFAFFQDAALVLVPFAEGHDR
jgi:hypothetical protein